MTAWAADALLDRLDARPESDRLTLDPGQKRGHGSVLLVQVAGAHGLAHLLERTRGLK